MKKIYLISQKEKVMNCAFVQKAFYSFVHSRKRGTWISTCFHSNTHLFGHGREVSAVHVHTIAAYCKIYSRGPNVDATISRVEAKTFVKKKVCHSYSGTTIP